MIPFPIACYLLARTLLCVVSFLENLGKCYKVLSGIVFPVFGSKHAEASAKKVSTGHLTL